MSTVLTPVHIAPLVHFLRHEKVILDADLAGLYGVEVRTLNQTVKRNADRFPEDFMFKLSREEAEEVLRLRSQNVISKRGKVLRSQSVTSKNLRGGRRYLPYAFTEQGVAMLSSVLRSPRAVEVNIAIMRTFVQLRRLMDCNRDLARKIEAMEQKYDEQFADVFEAIRLLIAEDDAAKAQPKRHIGFHHD